MNVVVVVVDALRASDVGVYGRADNTTPNIDELAADSLVFEQAFGVSNYTDVCMSSILSGRMPREHGVTHHGTAHTDENLRRLRERSPTFLPEILQKTGFETIGVDWMGRWHEWGYDVYGVEGGQEEVEDASLPRLTLDRLTDAVTDLPDPLLAPILARYYRWIGYDDFRTNCEALTDLAIERIDDANEPFFTLLHYWDVHPPYLPPKEYADLFSYDGEDEDLSRYFGDGAKGPLSAEFPPYATGEHETMADSKEAYDGAIRWVDEQLGRLLSHLRGTGALSETLVVVTADHGHNFGEHGIFSDNSGLYDTSIHVPLIVHHPDRQHRRVEGLVQHTDIVPTILNAVDEPIPENLRGNVLPETREYAFAEAIEHRMQMAQTQDWKLIVPTDLEYYADEYWYDGDGTPELYDLATDPGETTDVSTDHPTVVDRLKDFIEAELAEQEAVASAGGGRTAEIHDDNIEGVKARLNALGYADDDNV